MSKYLASDDANPDFVGSRNPDDALHVEFFEQEMKNEFKTNLEGRPIFDMCDMVKITVPGNSLFNVVTPVREEHKRRFPRHWAYFQSTRERTSAQGGTPVEQWPLLTKAEAAELKGLKFGTVEAIANASDDSIKAIGQWGRMHPTQLRERAKAFLAVASNTAAAQQYAAEAEKVKADNAELRDQVANLNQQVRALMELAEKSNTKGGKAA